MSSFTWEFNTSWEQWLLFGAREIKILEAEAASGCVRVYMDKNFTSFLVVLNLLGRYCVSYKPRPGCRKPKIFWWAWQNCGFLSSRNLFFWLLNSLIIVFWTLHQKWQWKSQFCNEYEPLRGSIFVEHMGARRHTATVGGEQERIEYFWVWKFVFF